MRTILHVVGARPNFMKLAPVFDALTGRVRQVILHTGQHYDRAMSDVFFSELGLVAPDINLEVGSASHAVQTAQVMSRLEPILLERQPDMVLVYGDVNSTVAAALVCSKLLIPLGHVEAGLRSRDRTMPEEINRLVTDVIADVLFTPSADADENLRQEGIPRSRVHLVGNVMIDTLVRLLPHANPESILSALGLEDVQYALVTLHRPSNVDSDAVLSGVLGALTEIAARVPVVFPVHPRTRRSLTEIGWCAPPGVHLLDPLAYLDFLGLERRAAAVITDSGGVQEETTFLGVPCITVRENTERPITVTCGTNVLVGSDPRRLCSEVYSALDRGPRHRAVPPLWDGQAARRIAAVVAPS
jgi:UDP-N-acetylglucosamine 2-epimerase (non-hydrolysing)